MKGTDCQGPTSPGPNCLWDELSGTKEPGMNCQGTMGVQLGSSSLQYLLFLRHSSYFSLIFTIYSIEALS